jgi:hypothetical protein
MTRFVVDADTAEALRKAHSRIELCDAAGRTLGYFDPANGPSHLSGEDREGPFTGEQLKQFRNEPGGKPLAEILQRLRSLK